MLATRLRRVTMAPIDASSRMMHETSVWPCLNPLRKLVPAQHDLPSVAAHGGEQLGPQGQGQGRIAAVLTQPADHGHVLLRPDQQHRLWARAIAVAEPA